MLLRKPQDSSQATNNFNFPIIGDVYGCVLFYFICLLTSKLKKIKNNNKNKVGLLLSCSKLYAYSM